MNRLLLALTNNHKTLWKYVLIAAAILFLTFLFPSAPRFRYDFGVGKVWQYETLKAPYDFPLSKTAEEIEKEKSETRKNSPVCFRIDDDAVKSILAPLLEKPQKIIIQSSEEIKLKSLCPALLTEICSRGIVSTDDEMRLERKGSQSKALIISTTGAEECLSSRIFTLPSARAFLESKIILKDVDHKQMILDELFARLRPTLRYDDSLTQQMLTDNLGNISSSLGLVNAGEVIISKGELIDDVKWKILESYRLDFNNHYPSGHSGTYFLSHLMLAMLSVGLLILFLFLFRKDIYADNRRIIFLLLSVCITALLYTWVLRTGFVNRYLIPLCLLPIIIRAFFDTRLALNVHLILVLMLGFIAPDGTEFVFMQMAAGMVAIYSFVNMRNRSQFFLSVLFIFLVYLFVYASIALMHCGSFSEISWHPAKWLMINAMLTLFAYPLIYVSEKLFGFVSDISLLELADSNSPLLRELASRAPGTFQHSLQVANLAESVIHKIGGNTLMVRAGALYHDIGKMELPLYFIENQSTAVNPHDELPFEESAAIIISHVIRGIEIAKNNKLPEQLIDFIRTHHGTTRVQYFYKSFLKNFPDEMVDEAIFTYPGPLPYSRETAVLMMADSVEASARSLKKPDEQSIEQLVDAVINNLISEKQFNNCDITFRDITTIKKIFRKMLGSMYHVRVEYPK